MDTVGVNHYDALADLYDAYRTAPPQDVYGVLREFGLTPSASVVDVGCGTALASVALAKDGAKVTLVDPSAAMLVHARERIPQAEVRLASAEALPLPDRNFDAALAADVFDVVDQPAALAEMHRVVKPGGIVAVWWTALSLDADVLGHRAAASRELGLDPVPEAMNRGFRAFYGTPFVERAIRTVPAVIRGTVEDWVGFERTRGEIYAAYGKRAGQWLDALSAALERAHGSLHAPIVVRALIYLYLGRV